MTKKVIIIDDSSTQLNMLKNFFEENSFEVYCAKSAKTGYDMIYDVAPDLIITDALMPVLGGFGLVKMIRENKIISKIPIIIYSVISKQSAKIYLKQEFGEYYLKKEDNLEELVDFSNEIIKKHPVSETCKNAILSTPMFYVPPQKEEESEKTQEVAEIKNIIIDEQELTDKLKNIYIPTLSDEKILGDFFKILYSILDYSVFMVDIFSFEDDKRKLFFDIKNVILSPVFQNTLKKHYRADEIVLFKKYAPNLKFIANEDEFLSKIEFNFFFKEKNIANVAFWAKEEGKFECIQNLEDLKSVLFNFFCIRYVNKYVPDKKDKVFQKYSNQSPIGSFLNLFEAARPKENVCLGIIKIINFNTVQDNNTDEDLDVLNLKISQSIIKLLDYGETFCKNSNSEYNLLLLAKDKEELNKKLDEICQSLNLIKDGNEDNLNAIAIGANCTKSGEFNQFSTRNELLSGLEDFPKNRKVLVK